MKSKQIRRIQFLDRVASWVISLGGLTIIACMLSLVVFMVWVTLPLFSKPQIQVETPIKAPLSANEIAAYAPGPYLEQAMAVARDGTIIFFRLQNGEVVAEYSLADETAMSVISCRRVARDRYNVIWEDGTLSLVEIAWETEFDAGGQRRLIHRVQTLAKRMSAANAAPSGPAMLRLNELDGSALHSARLLVDGSMLIERVVERQDFFGEIQQETATFNLVGDALGRITAVALNADGTRIFAGTEQGELLAWDARGEGAPQQLTKQMLNDQGHAVTALTFLFGEVSLAVGLSDGQFSVWHLIPGQPPVLSKLREMAPHDDGVAAIHASLRDKGLVSISESGTAFLRYMTSNRLLGTFRTDAPLLDAVPAERGNGLLGLRGDDRFQLWQTRVDHPEVSMKTLWGKVWYEGYREPGYVWQSSSGNDDHEAKMSLVPLLFGSLKGTFYGMLFSLPLALFAAIYVSHMMDPRLRAIVKPVIELMAAVPTVVVGFLGALWLAPRLEHHVLGVAFGAVWLPIMVALGVIGLMRWRRGVTGYEFLWGAPLVALAVWLAFQCGLWVQTRFFAGDFNLWLFQSLDITVDQRNCIVVGIALGFAVIPIIFTIAEDALHNVPNSLTAAAMALGSSRWQTMRRVVLPMAAPGIFAAIMIGFGRAVGETMIVLMATGNTPIMDVSILNGMRTLSANIAVEIPEAPEGGTLYRVLFLSAVLLFAVTFVVNTLAELVRVRMKQRYQPR